MATYYVDPAAGGANDGSSWADAWTSIQTAFDTATAGDTVYCRGTQTLAATLDIDTQLGTHTGGFIKYIGCNAAGNIDGTRFTCDANGGSYHVVTWANGYPLYWFENFRFTNTGTGNYDGVNVGGTNSNRSIFINCSFDNCRYGLSSATYMTGLTYYRCVFYSNRSHGLYGQYGSRQFFCAFRDNAGCGANYSQPWVSYGCIYHNNTENGNEYSWSGLDPVYINSVFDDNGESGYALAAHGNTAWPLVLGCRFTHHDGANRAGIDGISKIFVTAHCYFENNTASTRQDTLHTILSLEGGSSSSNMADQADTDEGYVDRAGNDFATDYVDANDPSLRRRAITVPWS